MTGARTAAEPSAVQSKKPSSRKRAAQKPAEDDQVLESMDDGLPLTKEEGEDDELHPLPDSASGFRYPDPFPRALSQSYRYPCPDILDLLMKRAKKDAHVAVKSSSIPNMNVGEVRKALNQIRKAGPAIRSEHLLFNGWPAGRFALAYIKAGPSPRTQLSVVTRLPRCDPPFDAQGHHAKRKSTKKGSEEGDIEEGLEGGEELPVAAEA
ncbi:hypothetical protein WJX74_009230 [Apatococcus lobatus]|uniref:Uncharacterized protein n=1 Tax=Apatococcus lobatus TaxID=904363 RepID=A0AAW1SFC4_9CHLO